MEMKWEWADDETLNCTSGASLEKWQVKSLLNGADENGLRSCLEKEGWTILEIDSFCVWVKKNGGFEFN